MLLNSSNDSLDPYDYHLSKNGMDCFEKLLECNRIHSSSLNMECGDMEEIIEEYNEEDVEEHDNIHELEYADESNEVVKNFNQNVLYALNVIVIIYLNSVVISVFVKNVIKIKVILIY